MSLPETDSHEGHHLLSVVLGGPTSPLLDPRICSLPSFRGFCSSGPGPTPGVGSHLQAAQETHMGLSYSVLRTSGSYRWDRLHPQRAWMLTLQTSD